MKKIFCLVAIILAAFSAHAQLKVGLPECAPDPSAVLDVSNTGSVNKAAFLAPQVQLTSAEVMCIYRPVLNSLHGTLNDSPGSITLSR